MLKPFNDFGNKSKGLEQQVEDAKIYSMIFEYFLMFIHMPKDFKHMFQNFQSRN